MTPTQLEMQAEFQRQLDAAHDDETLVLGPPRERPGPVTLYRRLAVDGQGCAVWGVVGPVLTVQTDGASLSNLRVEYTGDGETGGVALDVKNRGLTLDNVTVRGSVVGLAEEAGEWRYPHQLNLGALAAGMPHLLVLRLVTPVPCQLTSEVSGVRLEPRSLAPGAHEVRLVIDQMMKDTLVVGTIGIKTAFLRREIVLNAHLLAPTDGLPPPAREQGRVAWQPLDWDLLRVGLPKTSLSPPPRVEPPHPIGVPPTPLPAPAAPTPVVPKTVESSPVATQRRTVRPKQVLGGLFTSPRVGDSPAPKPPAEPEPTTVPPAATPPAEPPPAAKKTICPAQGLPAWATRPKPPGTEPPVT